MEWAAVKAAEVLVFKGMFLGKIVEIEKCKVSKGLSRYKIKVHNLWFGFKLCWDFSLLLLLRYCILFLEHLSIDDLSLLAPMYWYYSGFGSNM